MDSEGLDKSLQFLDLDNTEDDDCTILIHRKNAITNVQVKPNSGHDPKILSPDNSTERIPTAKK